MVGDRFGQSLDIGKELEEEKKAEEPQAPAASNTPQPKDNSQQEKKPEQPVEKPAEQPSEAPEKEEKAEAQPEAPAKETVPAEQSAEEQQDEAVPEEPEEDEEENIPKKAPDPAEEDVNEIITKDIPVLKWRKSIFEKIFSHSLVFWVVFVVVVTGMFFAWKLIVPAKAPEAAPEPIGYVPIDNITGIDTAAVLESVPEAVEAQNISSEPGQNSSLAPLAQENAGSGSDEELARILAEGLTG